eukprot:349205-Pyramimonas_sp.AAC.1
MVTYGHLWSLVVTGVLSAPLPLLAQEDRYDEGILFGYLWSLMVTCGHLRARGSAERGVRVCDAGVGLARTANRRARSVLRSVKRPQRIGGKVKILQWSGGKTRAYCLCGSPKLATLARIGPCDSR